MRYFRTEDGIYPIISNLPEIPKRYKPTGEYTGSHFEDNLPPEKFKQADTIEELKDFYIVDCPRDRKMNRAFTIKQEALHYSQDCLKPQDIEHTIYAAIWTDKGLIYVAKMNEKGTLELI